MYILRPWRGSIPQGFCEGASERARPLFNRVADGIKSPRILFSPLMIPQNKLWGLSVRIGDVDLRCPIATVFGTTLLSPVFSGRLPRERAGAPKTSTSWPPSKNTTACVHRYTVTALRHFLSRLCRRIFPAKNWLTGGGKRCRRAYT